MFHFKLDEQKKMSCFQFLLIKEVSKTSPLKS